MRKLNWIVLTVLLLLAAGSVDALRAAAPIPHIAAHWQPAGWGGGGFYWSARFSPIKNGTIYMGGDVDGAYKTTDSGHHWRLINNGLDAYEVYGLAVVPDSNAVYAGTEGGLCKSTDGGHHWKFIANSGVKGMDLRSLRGGTDNIGVAPENGNIVYVGSAKGSIYKTTDGGQTWKPVYQLAVKKISKKILQLQIGGANGAQFGGFWIPLASPVGITAKDCRGLQFSFQAHGPMVPKTAMLQLTTKNGIHYHTKKNMAYLFNTHSVQPVLLTGKDFELGPGFVNKHPRRAKTLPSSPDWPLVNRMYFVCVNGLKKAARVNFGTVYFDLTVGGKPLIARDFAKDKWISTYGNCIAASSVPAAMRCVVVAAKDSNLVAAASPSSGVLLSTNAGKTWHSPSGLPSGARSVAIAPTDPDIIFAAFGANGIYKSTDQGKTWQKCSKGISSSGEVINIQVAPDNAKHVYAIGSQGWGGTFYYSENGGKLWHAVRDFKLDYAASPVNGLPTAKGTTSMSTLTDLAINPLNPQQLFISANWNSMISNDGGKTWTQADRGADISCIYDIRFSGGKVYACAMDAGTLVSTNGGKTWRNLWPQGYLPAISGHNWRLAVSNHGNHIVATDSPWSGAPNCIIVSNNGGKTYHVVHKGLPLHDPTANTNWGTGYARALAADPNNPKILYLGIDGRPNGGIFKSTNGGNSWHRLAHQPGSLRVFFGLAVDPTDSNRLYWSTAGGGVWRSNNDGKTWKKVFGQEGWVFNLMVTKDGTLYAGGPTLWSSTNHGQSWTELTHFSKGWAIIGLAYNPDHPRTVWFSTTNWTSHVVPSGIFKTTNAGHTWTNITGNIPYHGPMVLRFNPVTHELWAGGVGLYKLKQ